MRDPRTVTNSSSNIPKDLAGTSLPSVENRFEEVMQAGYYTGILATYGVQWSLEKVARDTLQNFFDPDLSLDKVSIRIEKEGLPLFRTYRVRIEAGAEYSYQKLLHIGGTSKAGQGRTAGGFGEGSKILALVLLRDYDFTQVCFGSGDWQLDFYLAEPPTGSYDQKIKGLHCKLTRVPRRAGNFIDFVCGTSRHAQAFLDAKDLFYHSANPDFINPTMVVKLPGGGEAGFKFLGGDKYDNRGHLYDAGQRRHYRREYNWRGVEGLHVWTLGARAFHLDRDRGVVRSDELESKLLSPMVKAMSGDQLKQSIQRMKPIWPWKLAIYCDAAESLLKLAVSRAASLGLKFDFEPKYLAASLYLDRGVEELLQLKGYVLCHEMFQKLGMRDAKSLAAELKAKIKLVPTPNQLERIAVLKESSILLRNLAEKPLDYDYNIKDIWLFEPKEANRNLLGQHSNQHVWMSSKHLAGRYAPALATYLHEVLHDHGGDRDPSFGYALTDTLGLVIDVLMRESEQFKPLLIRWHRAKDS